MARREHQNATTETVTSFSVKGSEGQMDELWRCAQGNAAREVGREQRHVAEEVAAVSASMPVNPEVARLYAEGLTKLQIFDAASARTLLEKAVAAEPDYALAHSAWRKP